MEELLDFTRPLDVNLLDEVVRSFYNPRGASLEIQQFLVQFQQHPLTYKRFTEVFSQSNDDNTKILMISALEQCIKYRWMTLTQQERECLRDSIMHWIMNLCENENFGSKQRTLLLRKLNLLLVSIAKHEWPRNWPEFVPFLVSLCGKGEAVCVNTMQILLLLSEEVFEYGNENMTQQKMNFIQETFSQEFSPIFQLCLQILSVSENTSLVSITLSTLLRFLTWIGAGYIFESNLIELLTLRFFPIAMFRNRVLECLTEIVSINISQFSKASEYCAKVVHMYCYVITFLNQNVFQTGVSLSDVYRSGDLQSQAFVRYLSNFLTVLFRNQLTTLNNDVQSTTAVNRGLEILVNISDVKDTVIFRICLDYWMEFLTFVYKKVADAGYVADTSESSYGFLGVPMSCTHPLVQKFDSILSSLRVVMINQMRKPEEVLIVETEGGDFVRESLKDTDTVTIYKAMKGCLVNLTHLDPNDMQRILVEKLARQIDGSEWSWNNLNRLCWAIGSVSGALSEISEKRFLVHVIRDLLSLCEDKRGKEHKAVIASNIMYVVGQYPRFLKNHWKFLKTVVLKLFEFMHEKFPGVQEMACDTFLKISERCKHKFVTLQEDESLPFIEEVIDRLPSIVSDLELQQVYTVYEAMGHSIGVEPNMEKRQYLILRVMETPNRAWAGYLAAIQSNPSSIQDTKVIRDMRSIVRFNRCLCVTLADGYIVQFSRVFMEMLRLFQVYSQFVSDQIRINGEGFIQTAIVHLIRGMKSEIIGLFTSFIERNSNNHRAAIVDNFLLPMSNCILQDYHQSVPGMRDCLVLRLFKVILDKLAPGVVDVVLPLVFQSLFSCTIEMITKNFEDFPEHRVEFFVLLRTINARCFKNLFAISQQDFDMIYNSIIWAVRHLERTVAETGLATLLELIQNAEGSGIAEEFYRLYMTRMLGDIFAVLTDTLHKPGFMYQVRIIRHLLLFVESGRLSVPLWDISRGNFPSNQSFIAQYILSMLTSAFPHVSAENIKNFVDCSVRLVNDEKAFKLAIRDFLLRLKEFSNDDNSDLYLEEQRVHQEAESIIKAVPELSI